MAFKVNVHLDIPFIFLPLSKDFFTFVEHCISLGHLLTCADPEGGDRGSGPPLRFVRGGVLCGGLMGRRGGPKVVFFLF